MTVSPLVTREPRTNYRGSRTRLGQSLTRPTTGAPVQLAEVLDVIEGLLIASKHPDITSISRYGRDTAPGGGSPAGVCVKYQSASEGYIWGAVEPDETPIPIPQVMPRPRLRAPRLAIFVAQLLDVARPAQFKAWRLVAIPGVGPVTEQGTWPAGVSLICADGTKMMLRATAGSGPTDPAEEPFPDYTIPEEVSSWHLQASALSAAQR